MICRSSCDMIGLSGQGWPAFLPALIGQITGIHQSLLGNVRHMKSCKKCGIEKSLDHFTKDKSRKDGHHPYCKPCKGTVDHLSYLNNKDARLATGRQYRIDNAEAVAITKKIYAENHADEIAEYQRQYRIDNADVLAFQKSLYYWENREQCNQQSAYNARLNPDINRRAVARYVKNNPEARRESANRYVRAHPDKNVVNSGKRRAAKVRAIPKWFGELDEFIFAEAARLCGIRFIATNIKWHVDHMVPITSKKVCGLHVGCNVQVIPARINIAKSNKYWPDMW